jgi:hypothetical protein
MIDEIFKYSNNERLRHDRCRWRRNEWRVIYGCDLWDIKW